MPEVSIAAYEPSEAMAKWADKYRFNSTAGIAGMARYDIISGGEI